MPTAYATSPRLDAVNLHITESRFDFYYNNLRVHEITWARRIVDHDLTLWGTRIPPQVAFLTSPLSASHSLGCCLPSVVPK